MKRGFSLFAILAIALFASDQAIKFWARGMADGVEGRTISALFPGIFELKLVFNKGVAFGMFQGFGILLAPVAVGIAIAATWYSWKNRNEKPINHITAALLASGSVGNLFDRVVFGKVTDMFWVRAINFPVFNFADACITCAGALLLLGAAKDMLKIESRDRTEDATPATADQ